MFSVEQLMTSYLGLRNLTYLHREARLKAKYSRIDNVADSKCQNSIYLSSCNWYQSFLKLEKKWKFIQAKLSDLFSVKV